MSRRAELLREISVLFVELAQIDEREEAEAKAVAAPPVRKARPGSRLRVPDGPVDEVAVARAARILRDRGME